MQWSGGFLDSLQEGCAVIATQVFRAASSSPKSLPVCPHFRMASNWSLSRGRDGVMMKEVSQNFERNKKSIMNSTSLSRFLRVATVDAFGVPSNVRSLLQPPNCRDLINTLWQAKADCIGIFPLRWLPRLNGSCTSNLSKMLKNSQPSWISIIAKYTIAPGFPSLEITRLRHLEIHNTIFLKIYITTEASVLNNATEEKKERGWLGLKKRILQYSGQGAHAFFTIPL